MSSADGVVIKCLDGVDAPSFAEGIVCLAEGIKSNRRAKRSEYDLKAQQDMAEWAYGMLLISAFGLIVITVGVLVVLQSLRLARQTVDRAGDANALSSEAMIADQRAWITSKLIIGGDLEFFEGRAFIEVAARYQNIGKTPPLFGVMPRLTLSCTTQLIPNLKNSVEKIALTIPTLEELFSHKKNMTGRGICLLMPMRSSITPIRMAL